MNEEMLVAKLKTIFPQTKSVVEGPGDDCAVFRVPGSSDFLLAAVDQVAEGIHYEKGESPERIARKLLHRNISDIAAMGGTPQYAMLTIAANPLPESFLIPFHEALQAACVPYGMCVIGGDISSLPSPGAVFTLSILGKVAPEHLKLRRTARAGDLLCGTGCFGRSFPTEHHLTFTPRLAEGQALGRRGEVHAMMDVSDGLQKDALRMARDSGLGLELDPDRIPRRDGASLQEALGDGEDYELLFAVAPDQADTLISDFSYIPISKLGRFTKSTPGSLPTPTDSDAKGFDHLNGNN